MPQVGYGIHPQPIIFRGMVLFDFDHFPNFKIPSLERNGPSLGGWGNCWGRPSYRGGVPDMCPKLDPNFSCCLPGFRHWLILGCGEPGHIVRR
jgi:hypothetical protein